MMMKGTGVSPGIAIGKAFIIRKERAAATGILLTSDTAIAAQISLFDAAIAKAMNEVEAMLTRHPQQLTTEQLAILETQLELLNDPQLREDVIEKIESEKRTAHDALLVVTANLVAIFEAMDDEYLRARSADVQDIGDRILRHLTGDGGARTQAFEPGTIIIADDLAPSDTLSMDTTRVAGFVTQKGSKTSHTAIIAKSKVIPAVVGCGENLLSIQHGDTVIVDGATGDVLVNPDADTITVYIDKIDNWQKQYQLLQSLKDKPAVTTDGHQVTLSGNISAAGDLDDVFTNGGEGAGLFRTEFLYMDRECLPTEAEQFEFYKQAALKGRGKAVIVRTIDIGGDKELPYLDLPAELNPFLGYRAIRICLDRPALFYTQLRAILRAAVFGDLKIMLPMIAGLEEVKAAKQLLEQAKQQLRNEGAGFKEDMELGIMIEIPSAALTADLLAPEVDFFSIGTNDLCQYTLAVDRMNEKITHLYDPYHPGVLRLIDNVITQANRHNIHVGMCGEMASDPLATLLLLGMGLHQFSMSAAAIPRVKNTIINHTQARARQVYQTVMQMSNSTDIINYLQEANG